MLYVILIVLALLVVVKDITNNVQKFRKFNDDSQTYGVEMIASITDYL